MFVKNKKRKPKSKFLLSGKAFVYAIFAVFSNLFLILRPVLLNDNEQKIFEAWHQPKTCLSALVLKE